jgi:pantoate--beta-alanine ligase
MRIVDRVSAMRSSLVESRRRGVSVALVPTMGSLHEGHLRLVDEAKRRGGLVVMSIFVNPLQFGPHEDLGRYPRDLTRDRELASERRVDCLFIPTATDMYPTEPIIRISGGPVAETLEGVTRPGHFTGVLTVVAKLFHLVEPDVAVFGRKDFQQVTLVKRMVRDLNFPLTIDVAPTVRELDGLALSSRNSYLNPDERRVALALSRALRTLEQSWRGGEANAATLQRIGLEAMRGPGVIAEYCALIDEDLQPVTRVNARTASSLRPAFRHARPSCISTPSTGSCDCVSRLISV